jgi:hypothetical protein
MRTERHAQQRPGNDGKGKGMPFGAMPESKVCLSNFPAAEKQAAGLKFLRGRSVLLSMRESSNIAAFGERT